MIGDKLDPRKTFGAAIDELAEKEKARLKQMEEEKANAIANAAKLESCIVMQVVMTFYQLFP